MNRKSTRLVYPFWSVRLSYIYLTFLFIERNVLIRSFWLLNRASLNSLCIGAVVLDQSVIPSFCSFFRLLQVYINLLFFYESLTRSTMCSFCLSHLMSIGLSLSISKANTNNLLARNCLQANIYSGV